MRLNLIFMINKTDFFIMLYEIANEYNISYFLKNCYNINKYNSLYINIKEQNIIYAK